MQRDVLLHIPKFLDTTSGTALELEIGERREKENWSTTITMEFLV